MPPQNNTSTTTSGSMAARPQTSPKDFFLHLATTIALYVSVGSLIGLLYSLIDYSLPDIANSYYNYYSYGYSSGMRFSIASLIVVFPLFVLFVKMIQGGEKAAPEKRALGIKRWLSYLTIFAAIAIVAGDLITLIYTFLNGDLTTRFGLKVLTLLIVSGLVFWAYINQVRQSVAAEVAAKRARIAIYIGAVLIVATIVTGFVIVGSPYKARMMERDANRTSDLISLQSSVADYWNATGKLPKTLDDTQDGITVGYGNRTDRLTGASYEYAVKAPLTFELCATFETKSDEGRTPNGDVPAIVSSYFGDDQSKWVHGIGRTCFERTIKPELHPKVTPKAI